MGILREAKQRRQEQANKWLTFGHEHGRVALLAVMMMCGTHLPPFNIWTNSVQNRVKQCPRDPESALKLNRSHVSVERAKITRSASAQFSRNRDITIGDVQYQQNSEIRLNYGLCDRARSFALSQRIHLTSGFTVERSFRKLV
jgi:hypothetical protein